MNKILVIAGPTAVGKTSLSISLAKSLNGEIVSADSMQVYKTLDIGTAKPTLAERCGVPHHMLDVCEPSHRYSVAEYVRDAVVCIEDILSRGKLPIIVGGTGLYIDHLLFETDFDEGDTAPEIRNELNRIAEEKGGGILRAQLAVFDPETAGRLHDNDIKRIVRAIEFYRVTGKTISSHNKSNDFTKKRYDADFFVLNCADRSVLYDRINKRVDAMICNGLIDEAKRVCSAEWFDNSTAAQAIGYKEFLPFFQGESSIDFCVDLLKQRSRNYAKRQLTWFRSKKEAVFIDIENETRPFDVVVSRRKEFEC